MTRTFFGSLCVALALSCATATQPFSGRETSHAFAHVDVDPALVDELSGFTGELIRARAENPPGNEKRVVDVIAARLSEAGIDVVTAPFDAAGKRTNLKAVLRGKHHDAPIVVFGHSDVVPADPTEWSAAPYEGTIRNGKLIGRGAVDMLSMDALAAVTLIALKRADVPLERDIILVIAGDEEVDGKGIVEALRAWPELKKAQVALTEGGFLLESYLRPGEDLAAIAVAEKGLFQFTLEARGPSGHGSTPLDDAAPDRLVRAVSRVLARDARFTITKPTERQLLDIGRSHGGVEGFVLSTPSLASAFAQPLLDATPSSAALFRDTCALTILESGIKRNVIPPSAKATFDCRLLPGTDPQKFRDKMLATVDDPRVSLTVLNAAKASGSDPDAAVVDVIAARIKDELPGAAIVTTLSKGATDCRFLRAAGVPCYGFIPIRITRQELESMHGKDEDVRIDELERALPRLVDVVATLAR